MGLVNLGQFSHAPLMSENLLTRLRAEVQTRWRQVYAEGALEQAIYYFGSCANTSAFTEEKACQLKEESRLLATTGAVDSTLAGKRLTWLNHSLQTKTAIIPAGANVTLPLFAVTQPDDQSNNPICIFNIPFSAKPERSNNSNGK